MSDRTAELMRLCFEKVDLEGEDAAFFQNVMNALRLAIAEECLMFRDLHWIMLAGNVEQKFQFQYLGGQGQCRLPTKENRNVRNVKATVANPKRPEKRPRVKNLLTKRRQGRS